jgi:hypothetical protein
MSKTTELFIRLMASDGNPDPQLLAELRRLPPQELWAVTLHLLRKLVSVTDEARDSLREQHMAKDANSKRAALEVIARVSSRQP